MLVLLALAALSTGPVQARPEPWWLPDPLGLFNGPASNNASAPTVQRASGYSCKPNALDQPQYCLCNPGQKISVFASKHYNHQEDRIWKLECANIQPEFIVSDTSNWYSSSSYNAFDRDQHWDGSQTNSFLVGMQSEHNNYREDRRYQMFYARSENWVLSGCKPMQQLNNFDREIDHILGEDEVIAQVHSVHNNEKEDRKFTIQVCRLVKKCGELLKIEYDTNNAKETQNDGVFAGESRYDNTKGKSANSVTAEIEVTMQKTLSDSYTFERTSGHTNEGSMSVTAGYNWGVIVAGGHIDATAGFSHTWSTSESWSRSNTKEFSEGNSRKTSYTANCGAGCNCKLLVSVTVGQAEIPYTMTSKSKGADGAVCTEKGVMKAVRTWNAQAISEDTGC